MLMLQCGTNLPSGGASVTVTGSSAEVSGLPYPLNYYFRVNASNTDGTSNWSDELLVTPAPIVGTDGCVVAAPPQELAGFAKHCAAGGIGIVGSNEVSDFAIKLAWNHIMNMLAAHPDVHREDGAGEGASRLEGRLHAGLQSLLRKQHSTSLVGRGKPPLLPGRGP